MYFSKAVSVLPRVTVQPSTADHWRTDRQVPVNGIPSARSTGGRLFGCHHGRRRRKQDAIAFGTRRVRTRVAWPGHVRAVQSRPRHRRGRRRTTQNVLITSRASAAGRNSVRYFASPVPGRHANRPLCRRRRSVGNPTGH